MSQVSASSADSDLVCVALRVLRADLERSFTLLRGVTSMNPYAIVEWHPAEGAVQQVRTRADIGGGLHPRWNHTTSEQRYTGREDGSQIVVKVCHERLSGLFPPTFCGSASATLEGLLATTSTPTGSTKHDTAPIATLPLVKDGQVTGSIMVQALLVRTASGDQGCFKSSTSWGSRCYSHQPNSSGSSLSSWTPVEPEDFRARAEPLGVSGGTAAFYRLRLSPSSSLAAAGKSEGYYVGKDLSHARGECDFYEQALELHRSRDGGGLHRLLSFMFEYKGILTCSVGTDAEACLVNLLVMRNLFDGAARLRNLDIKIGQQTASAGWQGKSRLRAYRQALVDSATNSTEEGFRLEGFDSPPPALESMDPLLDLAVLGMGPAARKKAFRIMLQRMSAQEMLRHFFDVHQVPADFGDDQLATCWAPIELAELAHHEVLCRLTVLALACRLTLVPQKWIGSSVALGFDCGTLPARGESEDAVRRHIRVNIFDWGRSELNTLERHMALSRNEQNDRTLFWGYYLEGIDRLLWSTLRSYWHRFGGSARWQYARIVVYDFDSMSDNDFIGQVTIPLIETPETTVVLLDANGGHVMGWMGRAPSMLTYSIEARTFPVGSRLSGAWKVHLAGASNLPVCDWLKGQQPKSDPFAVLEAVAEDGRRFRQQTSVIVGALNPRWGETLEVPIASSDSPVEEALISAGSQIGDSVAAELVSEPVGRRHLLPPEGAVHCEEEAAYRRWTARMDTAAQAASQVCSGSTCKTF